MSDFNNTQKTLFAQLQKHSTHYIENEERGIVVDDLDVDGFIQECSKLVQANGANASDSSLHLQRVSKQRDLLIAFIEYHDKQDIIGGNERCIDNFLEANNCG